MPDTWPVSALKYRYFTHEVLAANVKFEQGPPIPVLAGSTERGWSSVASTSGYSK
jgi:hypothetical protein